MSSLLTLLHATIFLTARYLRVWDAVPKTDEEKGKFRLSGKKREPSIWSLSGHTDAITCVAWSPLGCHISQYLYFKEVH